MEVLSFSDAMRSFRLAEALIFEQEMPDKVILKKIYELMQNIKEGKETGIQLANLIAYPLSKMLTENQILDEYII